jgi:TRAP-type C4-dicarboxylate transport system permease small subunit
MSERTPPPAEAVRPPSASVAGFLERLQFVQLRLAALALVIMMMVTIVDVSMRYAANRPVSGSYDLVECMLVVFVFHGMAAVFLRRQNIVIDVVDYMVGARMVRVLAIMADVLSVVGLLLLTWAMIGPAWQAYQYGDRKLELALPLYVLWIVALTGMLGTILCAVAVRARRAALADTRIAE